MRFVLAGLIITTSFLTGGTTRATACDPEDGVAFICGGISPEDLVPVPRSEWVIASGYQGGGGVHLINRRDFTSIHVFPTARPRGRPDTQTYTSCPGPIDPSEKEAFSAHGLNVRPGAGGVHTVYVVRHGLRESIEVFELDVSTNSPAFTWVGCVVAPGTANLNSVSPLPEGGFVATNFMRRGDPAAAQALVEGGNTGEVWEWQPAAGWRVVPGSESPGPNGIEASRDGKWLYVNLWPVRKVMRLSRGQTPVTKDVVDVGFHPDNIRWQEDGTLLAAGQGGPTLQRVLECISSVCADATSNVARIDAPTLRVQDIVRYPANAHFFSATSALQVWNEVWMGSINGDRIARYPIR